MIVGPCDQMIIGSSFDFALGSKMGHFGVSRCAQMKPRSIQVHLGATPRARSELKPCNKPRENAHVYVKWYLKFAGQAEASGSFFGGFLGPGGSQVDPNPGQERAR